MRSWIIPCNTKHFDVVSAFSELDQLEWRQSTNVSVGDIIYIYVGAPVQAILYKCVAKQVDIHPDELQIDDSKFENPYPWTVSPAKRFMLIEREQSFPREELTLSKLREYGLKSCVQGPCVVYSPLKELLESCDNQK